MAKSDKIILRALQERGEATRPQLAAATGLSLVTVTHVIAKLCGSGAVSPGEMIPSGGGRPVRQYRYNRHHGYHVLIHLVREDKVLCGRIEELDMEGGVIRQREGHFAYIDKESFDGWLDTLCRRRTPRSITLCTGEEISKAELAAHWQKRYRCTVHTPSVAAVLSKSKEGEATLYLPEGENASCAIYRNGKIQESGPLHLLPLPCEWREIQHSDRSLLEESVARLLQIITCLAAPGKITLHSTIRNPRLLERIRYNADTKLKGQLPPIHFTPISQEELPRAMRRYVARQA